MGRFFFFGIVVLGFWVAIHLYSTQSFLVPGQSLVAAAVVPLNTFDQTGVLVFYPNNVGPVPYLVYDLPNGRGVTKALVSSEPILFLAEYTYQRVHIIGRLEDEHVVVSSISFLPA